MILCDVNVFIRAHKEETERHVEFKQWLTEALEGEETFGRIGVRPEFFRANRHEPSRL